MTVPLTRTKIVLPRRPANLLTRQRLLDVLDELLNYRLIIIAAPAGYGKTSLLVDLAHHTDLPTCWYALDALDNDPHRFVAHLIGAIAQRFPSFGKQSAAALQHAASPDLDVDRLVSAIVNDAYEQIREHFVLVLDDYHLVGDSETINHFISQFIQKADENCHLVLSSRTLLSLPDLPLMVARSQVGGLALGDLSFRADEMQALLLQNYRLTIPAPEAERLVQETEGWVAGLLLSAQTMWQGMADRARIARASGVGLYDYLAQQVLDQQPRAVRDFLLQTSLMEEFDAGLCEAVLGTSQDWRRAMDTVLQSNLFVLPVDDGGTWLRYHHLFRDFLQARIAQERPEERADILRRLAAVFIERGEWEKAHAMCERLGDESVTADVIEQAGSPMIKSGRWTTLANWIDALPADAMSSRLALLSLRGDVAVMLGKTEQGLSLLNQAELALRGTRDMPRLARTLVRRATAHRFLGEYQASLMDADAALALAKEGEDVYTLRAEALRVKGLGLRRLGKLIEAEDCLQQSSAMYSRLQNEENVALVQIDLGMLFRTMGRYQQAESVYKRSLEYWRKIEDTARQASVLNNLGGLTHSRGDYERAASYLEEALARARQSGFARLEAFSLASIGDLYADLDAWDAAQDAYDQARKIAQRVGDRFLTLYLDLADANLARSKGDLSSARALIESARPLIETTDSLYEKGLYELAVGQTDRADARFEEAIAHLERAVRQFDDGAAPAEACRAHIQAAVAYQSRQEAKAALTHLGHACRHLADMESEHVLITASRDAKALLEAAQNDPLIGSQVSHLLLQVLQFEQMIPTLRRRLRRQPSIVSVGPPRLTFQAFGNIQVFVDGRRVTGADWQAQVARDLVFCLLAHPDGLAREAIGLIFWPDHSPAQLKLQFKKTVYRLRRALGQDVVLLEDDRYRFNHALDYGYDVDLFRANIQRAKAASDIREQIATYHTATGLYRGAFLPELDGFWVVSERERLWQMFVQAGLALGETHLGMCEFGAALECCLHILDFDPSVEQAHRLAMRIHAAAGNRAHIVRQFELCRQAVLEEANAPLSPQTETLYESLMCR